MSTDGTWHRVPCSARLFIHPDSGRDGRLASSLAGTSDWRRSILDRVGAALVGVLGASSMPAAERDPWPRTTAAELEELLSEVLPGLRLVAAVAPRQPDRERLSLLARTRGNPVVVKLATSDAALEREAAALRMLEHAPLPGIETPQVLGSGTLALHGSSVGYLATTSISIGRQRPAIDEPLRTFESDLTERLAELPGRPGDDSVPVHGDLTPWNLRRTPRGLALFDWEQVGWGAAGDDLRHYRAACETVRRPWSRSRNGGRNR